MTKPAERWTIRLTAAAETDLAQIVSWTAQRFGSRQAATYSRTIQLAAAALIGGPTVVGTRRRDDIAPGLHTFHVARGGRKGRHFLMLRSDSTARTLDILRILHDAMDLAQHLDDAP